MKGWGIKVKGLNNCADFTDNCAKFTIFCAAVTIGACIIPNTVYKNEHFKQKIKKPVPPKGD